MRISDANPGDVLRGQDGALWVRGQLRARCVYDPADGSADDDDNAGGDSLDLDVADRFGPFTRMIPEPTDAP